MEPKFVGLDAARRIGLARSSLDVLDEQRILLAVEQEGTLGSVGNHVIRSDCAVKQGRIRIMLAVVFERFRCACVRVTVETAAWAGVVRADIAAFKATAAGFQTLVFECSELTVISASKGGEGRASFALDTECSIVARFAARLEGEPMRRRDRSEALRECGLAVAVEWDEARQRFFQPFVLFDKSENFDSQPV